MCEERTRFLFGEPPESNKNQCGTTCGTSTDGLRRLGLSYRIILPVSRDAYLNLARAYLFVLAKVTNGNGMDFDADNAVGPVNNWLHSLFIQVEVYPNDTLVTHSTNTYPFQAYVEILLSYRTKTPLDTRMPST